MRSATMLMKRRLLPAVLSMPLCALGTIQTPSRAFHAAVFSHSAPRWCTSRVSGGDAPSASTPQTSSSSSSSDSAGRGNFFVFFEFEPSPVLDVADLQKRYHNLQRRVHPDQQNVQAKAAEASAQSADGDVPPSDQSRQAVSDTDTSMYGNVAYETLRDPYARCRYLLRLSEARRLNNGAPLSAAQEEALMAEDDKEITKYRGLFNDKPLSEDFLMEMLAMNELIFAGDRDDEGVRRQMQVLKADLEERDDDYFTRVQGHWDAQDIDEYRQTMMEWTYIANALRHLKDRL